MHAHYAHCGFVHRVICLSCSYTPGLEKSVNCCYNVITFYLLRLLLAVSYFYY